MRDSEKYYTEQLKGSYRKLSHSNRVKLKKVFWRSNPSFQKVLAMFEAIEFDEFLEDILGI